ncbi:LysR substrate-binding domain-containing protein, partial [Klebsiella pneumoniae]|uniref:LysR substrate-binding domain-containing protein n=1 Tax=Klebsiella pneumoniae TaxID=573 RepID=UPI0022AF4A1B
PCRPVARLCITLPSDRRVQKNLTTTHFLFMLETLRNSDLVAVLPERLVRGQSGLVVVEPPLAVAGFEMLMLWHERWHRDPAHQWLRQFIVNSLEEQTC